MTKIDKFEQKYLRLPLEYRVIGDLMNRLKDATDKEKFILQHKLNRAVRLMDCKEAYDPNDPANYGAIRHSQVGPSVDQLKYTDFQKEKKMIQGGDLDEEDDDDFSEIKEKDDKLLEKLNDIDKKLEEKLAELDHTFGKKGRALEEEIKELADERSALTERSRRPLYRKVSLGIILRLFCPIYQEICYITFFFRRKKTQLFYLCCVGRIGLGIPFTEPGTQQL